MSSEPKICSREEEKFFLIVVLVLAAAVGTGSWFAAAAFAQKDNTLLIKSEKSRRLENFSLTDGTGRNVTRAELDGKILAVSFLFTGCSLTCPEVTRRMTEIQQLTARAPDVRLLSLTLDPRSDTPPVLAKWGARFGVDTNRWFLLTGDQARLHWLIGTSFLATETNNPFNSMPGNFAGTERVAIVDKHGIVRCFFDGLQAGTPAAVVAEIEKLRKEK
jgi:cytochrome oxidase Cu insertion factor (SCO1/SenC/PrrC family)